MDPSGFADTSDAQTVSADSNQKPAVVHPQMAQILQMKELPMVVAG